MSGAALRALVAAAEAPGTGLLVYTTMTKQMGIDLLEDVPDDGEPLPLDQRPLRLVRKAPSPSTSGESR